MSKLLNNCPHCGGVLDDDGRCVYCKSKVYDLTDINIDMDSRDIILMKVKYMGQDIEIKCYPSSIKVNIESCYDALYCDNEKYVMNRRPNTTIELELVGI